jgi:hypothetical protein
MIGELMQNKRFETTRLPLASFPDERLVHLYDYWRSKCRDRPFPARQDIDPTDIPWALPRVALVTVEHDPLRFRYRLEGTALSDTDNQRLTGRLIDELRPSEYADIVRRHYTEVVESEAPSLYAVKISLDFRAWSYYRLALPLATATAGAGVGIIMTYSTPIEGLDKIFESLLRGETIPEAPEPENA